MNKEKLVERYEQLAREGKPLFPSLEKEFKRAKSTIQRQLSNLRKSGEIFDYGDYLDPAQKIEQGKEGKYFIAAKGTSIRTVKQLLAVSETDTKLFEVTKHRINTWEGHAKGPDGRLVRFVNWQVRVELGLKEETEVLRQVWQEIKEEIPAIKIPKSKIAKPAGNTLFELGIFDFHLANDEADWGLDAAEEAYIKAVIELAEKARIFKPERILLPIGNDFFHIDTHDKKTSNGTQLSSAGPWSKMFKAGIKLHVWAIEYLLQIAPVDVVVIPGNHDEVLSRCLGEVLNAWFREIPQVKVLMDDELRTYYQYGNTMLGFTHGKYEPHEKLPMLMATEMPHMWAATTFREFHVGHVHHRNGKSFFSQYVDTDGVLVRVLPSLVMADEWHRRKGLVTSTKAAEAYIYSRHDGLVATLHAQRSQR